MLSLPTLFDPRTEATDEVAVAGARIWVSERGAPGTTSLVPDLSFDVVAAGGHLVRPPRTIRATEVPAPAGLVAGVRLPIAATAPHVDADWAGWRLRPRDRDGATEQLASAIRLGAIRWRLDEQVAALLGAARRPDARPAEVADALGVSARTLHRRTVAALGMPPSHVLRILRLWRLVAAARTSSLADAAALAGYADQAHATREARDLAGRTPRQLAAFAVAGSFKTPAS